MSNIPVTPHQKIQASLISRSELLQEYEDDGETWQLPVCKDCGERMIPMNLEDPEAGIWKVWLCGCHQDGTVHRTNGSLTVWSCTMDERRASLNIQQPYEDPI